MNILFSWIPNSDFKDSMVVESGPSMEFHQYHFEHDKHILLSSANDQESDIKSVHLEATLRRKYPSHTVEVVYMGIAPGALIMPDLILPKVETLLKQYVNHELTLFISPGTPAMQMCWYMAVSSLKLEQVRLVQTIPPQFRKGGKNELFESMFRIDGLAGAAILPTINVPGTYLISPSIKPVYDRARSVAATDKTFCLIFGATGTGKEHLARFIHEQSARRDKPFITLNCSAFSDQLLESRLFGYKKGAFTDAKEDTPGIFEEANGGTLFLDEIGDISPFMQQSLLRVLQTGDYSRIGEGRTIRQTNVRVVAATHRDLPALCEAGTFRWDLYYRLAVVELELPSLQKRGFAEKKQMIDHLNKLMRTRLKRTKLLAFSKDAEQLLEVYSFPGNIRQLENLIESLYTLVPEGELIDVHQLPKWLKNSASKPDGFNWKLHEAALLRRALAHFDGNLTHTSKAMGYGSLNTLKTKIKDYNIS